MRVNTLLLPIEVATPSKRNGINGDAVDETAGWGPYEEGAQWRRHPTADTRATLFFRMVQDFSVFTEKRLLIVDNQGITGRTILIANQVLRRRMNARPKIAMRNAYPS